jgi:hypothetical protein
MSLHDQLLKKIAGGRAPKPAADGDTLVMDSEGLDKLAEVLETLSESDGDLDAETEKSLQAIVTEHELSTKRKAS